MKKLFNRILAIMAVGLMLGACEKNTFPEVAEYFDTTSGAKSICAFTAFVYASNANSFLFAIQAASALIN